ncbi:hypothetical protein CEK26_011423 [Fusarium fujikuroi]|nr:hypothetical protein CEK26_011423 [Fusarium fujikuroi]
MADSTTLTKPTAEEDGLKIVSMMPFANRTFVIPSRVEKYPSSDISHYDWRYLEPSRATSNKMQDLIYKELKTRFFQYYAESLRLEARFKLGWRGDGSMTNINTLRLPGSGIDSWGLADYFNKEVMVYFEHNSVDTFQSGKIAGYIFREWLQLTNGRPFFKRSAFFGKPVYLQEGGPQRLGQLSVFHDDLSLYVTAHAEDLVEFRRWTGEMPPEDDIPGKVQPWREYGYFMCHLFCSLYLVVDKQSYPLTAGPYDNPRGLRGYDRIHDMEHYTERELDQCTVLLVKTGDDAHLSSPVTFNPLFEAGLAMHVNRDDYSGGPKDEETVVRVKLGTAVRFVWELLQKGKESFEELETQAQMWEEEQNSLLETWLEDVMSHCDEIGVDNNDHMWVASRRAIARANGKAFDNDQVYPLWGRLRQWDL